MKVTTAHRPGSQRGWARRTGQTVAALASCALLATACSSAGSGGSHGSGGSNAGSSARSQHALAFARCMRSHGVTDFPDPDSNGRFPDSSGQEAENNPHSGTAFSACRHLMPSLSSGSNSKVRRNLSQLLKIARCMRSHGFPNYPDPNLNNSPVNLSALGINPNSPQFQAAQRTCHRLYPPPHHSPTQGGGS